MCCGKPALYGAIVKFCYLQAYHSANLKIVMNVAVLLSKVYVLEH